MKERKVHNWIETLNWDVKGKYEDLRLNKNTKWMHSCTHKKKFTILNKTSEIEQIGYDQGKKKIKINYAVLKLWMLVIFILCTNKKRTNESIVSKFTFTVVGQFPNKLFTEIKQCQNTSNHSISSIAEFVPKPETSILFASQRTKKKIYISLCLDLWCLFEVIKVL